MKKYLAKNKFMALVAILIAIVGIGQSIVLKDFAWFQRSGSLIVGVGIVLLARTFIVGKDLLLYIKSAETPYNINSEEHFKFLSQPTPEYIKNDLASRIAIGWIGPLISFIGTVIWGYGDLLNRLT
jgi:hypothetical protein